MNKFTLKYHSPIFVCNEFSPLLHTLCLSSSCICCLVNFYQSSIVHETFYTFSLRELKLALLYGETQESYFTQNCGIAQILWIKPVWGSLIPNFKCLYFELILCILEVKWYNSSILNSYLYLICIIFSLIPFTDKLLFRWKLNLLPPAFAASILRKNPASQP